MPHGSEGEKLAGVVAGGTPVSRDVMVVVDPVFLHRLGSTNGDGLVVVLTGAGISAESGIPTFRGEEGYWTIGSREYHPQEMATLAMFELRPEEVWRWYLYRRDVCQRAQPNPAHIALVRLERALADRFLLVTQNVDGLHLRAGNSVERTYQIHGNLEFMRCSQPCCGLVVPVPEEIGSKGKESRLTERERRLLHCPRCGEWSRPHVLWFDEYYDEPLYHFESALTAASRASLLLVVGTSGSTNLPMQMGYFVARRKAAMVEVNLEPTPFTRLASTTGRGCLAQGKASELLPPIIDHLIGVAEGREPTSS